MFRAVGWMLAGGLALGVAGVALGWIDLGRVPLLGRVFGQTRDVEPEPAKREPTEPGTVPERATIDPSRTASSPTEAARLAHCCVDRQQLGAATLFEIQDALAQRWPKLNRLASDEVNLGDRVGFLIEVGSEPESFDREIMTGTIVAMEPETLDVELDAPTGTRHGLSKGERRTIPRRAVLGWARGQDPQRRVALTWRPEPDNEGLFVRHVEVEQLIALAFPEHHTTMRWLVEPASVDLRVLDLRADSLAHVVFGRGTASGRVIVRLSSGDPEWGSALLGHGAFQVQGAS